MRRSVIQSLSVLLFLLTGSCAGPREAGAPEATTAPASEPSVRPGINAEYRNPDVDKWVERFETESREIYHERNAIVAALGLKPGTAVADIGAGTGLFTELFARQVGPRGRVFAVDIVPEFLEHIRSRCKQAGLVNVQTILCKEDSVELRPASVDLAFLCDTYHHFEYPRSTLRSIRSALRPSGELVVIDFERIEGASREWVLNHVRAGRQTVVSEIERAGFRLVREAAPKMLKENYMVRFRRGDR